MKTAIRIIISVLTMIPALFLLSSCGNDGQIREGTGAGIGKGERIRLAVTDAAYDNLDIKMLIFKRAEGDQTDYFLEKTVTVASQTFLQMPLKELKENEYRFFFMASDKNSESLRVVNQADNSDLTAGNGWADLRLKYDYASTTQQNPLLSLPLGTYYGITDMTGTQIIDAGQIEGSLTRIVGRAMFDFYRASGTVDNPVPVDRYVDGNHEDDINTVWDPDLGVRRPETEEEGHERKDKIYEMVGTVLDRIYETEIIYSNLTDRLRYDVSGQEWVADGTSSAVLRQTVTAELGDNFRLLFPQTHEDIVDPAIAAGSVRLNGLCLLPSENGVSISMTFNYLDTTAACGSPGHAHEEPCYDRRSLVLNLPKTGSPNKIRIVADHLTRNKAAISVNRVIDIPAGGGFVIDDFEWIIN